MSFDINQYFNCNYGPCDELNRLLNTPNPYSALTQQYIDCLPDPTPFPCSAITHCTSGGTGTDTYVTGGTYNDTTNNINFSGNSAETTFDVDLTSLVSSVSANTFVIAGTYVDSTDTLTLLRNDGNFVNITGLTDTYVTGTTLSGDKSYTTRNDSEQVLILSGGTNITLSNPSTNLIQISTDDNIITPISIINNSGYIDRPSGGVEYIGNRLGGFTTSPWDADKSRWDVSLINCGVPFPNSIQDSVSNAFNLCGDVYVEGHVATVVVRIIVYTFECSNGSSKPALTQLGLTSFEVETGEPGTATCWSIDVNTGENVINECETNLLISFQIGERDTCNYIKFSYKGTIEKIVR